MVHGSSRTARLKLLASVAGALSVFTVGPVWAEGGSVDTAKVTESTPVTVADPVPDGFATWKELFHVQDQLGAIADRLDTHAHAGDEESGFASIRLAVKERQVLLYWKGRLSASVQDIVNEVNSSRTASVRVQSAAYSERELFAAQQKITSLALKAPKDSAAGSIKTIAPIPDASGLRVTTTQDPDTMRSAPVLTDSGVHVVIEKAVKTTPVYDRWNDAPAYWGGNHYSTPGTGCSSGFAMNNGLMVTAAHCGDVGDPAWIKPPSKLPTAVVMGWVKETYPQGDLAVVKTNGGAAGSVYTGGPGTTNQSTLVTDARTSYQGQWVCTSGSYSGLRCGIQVDFVGITQLDGPLGPTYHLVQAHQLQGLQAARNGDSGGPVIQINSDMKSVTAKGVISQGLYPLQSVTCVGVSSNGICTDTIYYEDIKVAEALWGPVRK
ncbi:S1 family peptidase [Streptomyces sp. NPDC052013]|uniref:S1 family peptidase n=1 Tax=Streptomyces sp. NPDC052013 TaxID=3365679 RepID=UPI0037D4DCCF